MAVVVVPEGSDGEFADCNAFNACANLNGELTGSYKGDRTDLQWRFIQVSGVSYNDGLKDIGHNVINGTVCSFAGGRVNIFLGMVVVITVCIAIVRYFRKGDAMFTKKLALGFGIAMLFPLVAYYGVSTFSSPPKWQDYRVEELQGPGKPSPETQALYMEAQRELDDARRAHRLRFEKAYFSVAVPLGIAAIVAGAFLAVQAIGTGLMFGGILSLIHGYLLYWQELPDVLRFVSVLAALIILVIVGYLRFGRDSAGS